MPAEDIAVGDGQMREASFSRKNSVRFSYAKLRFAAVLYAAVPVAVFLLGWLKKPADASKAIVIDPALFRTTRLFKGLSILIMVILSTIYYIFW